jgi:hypothetical protein
VIAAALEVDPVLTARCLRTAESLDEQLLRQFVAGQRAVLCDVHAGEYCHGRAAQALAEYGRGAARAALWEVVSDAAAVDTARVAALGRLAAMPSQVRFETVTEKLRQEMEDRLPGLFDPPATVAVQKAAIDAIRRTGQTSLSAYLLELVPSEQWPLSRAAWNTLGELGVKTLPKHQAAYRANCVKRLEECERELYAETVRDRMDEFNAERVEILGALAAPANLPLLLRRRFSVGIHEEMARLVDKVSRMTGTPPEEAATAWAVLTAHVQDPATMICPWLDLLQGTCDLAAAAAAHRLADLGEELPVDKLRTLFSPDRAADRLSAFAALAEASQDTSLTEPLDDLIEALMNTTLSKEAMDAFSNLASALAALDQSRGTRRIAVVSSQYRESSSTGRYPWWLVELDKGMLTAQDYTEILTSGSELEIRAALTFLRAIFTLM